MSNETKAIIIAPVEGGFKVTIPGEALRMKETALQRASVIKQVTTADEQTAAINAVAVLKGLSKGVEDTRKEVKDPYYKAGQAIDAKAKEYRKEIDARVSEIESLIGSFQKAEREKQEAAEREAEQLRQQAEAAVNSERSKVAVLEEQLQAANEWSATARGKKKAAAQAEVERLTAELTQAQIDAAMAQDDAADSAGTVVMPGIAKATGAAIREKVTFEVTDIEALYRWDLERRARAKEAGRELPAFIRLEVNKDVFGQYANIVSDAELDSIPGVKFTRETKAAVRAVAPAIALF